MRSPTPYLTAWVAGDPRSLSRSLSVLLVKNHLASDSQAWLTLRQSRGSSFQPPSRPPTPTITPGGFRIDNSEVGPRNLGFEKLRQVWGGVDSRACTVAPEPFIPLQKLLGHSCPGCSQRDGWWVGSGGSPAGVDDLGSSPAQTQGPLLPGPQVNYSSKMICQVIQNI